MPTYDYRCPQCGKFTVTQSIKDKALSACPTCGSSVQRLIGKNVNILYKCSGFYCTDTKSPSGTVGKEPEGASQANEAVADKTKKPDTKAVNE